MKKHRIRSLCVSLMTAALDAGLFALCTFLLVGSSALLVARWICGAIGAGCNFGLNRIWAFNDESGDIWRQIRRYSLAAATAVSLATLTWWVLHHLTGWDPRWLHLMSMGLVWLFFTYPLLAKWVFRPSTSP